MSWSVGTYAWLSNSLSNRANELRKMERRCRRAYTQGHMAEAATRLADVYASAAARFEDELYRLTAERRQSEGGDRE